MIYYPKNNKVIFRIFHLTIFYSAINKVQVNSETALLTSQLCSHDWPLNGCSEEGSASQANVATLGTADSFLRVTHVTRTRRAHQITASSLYHLLQKAYLAYCSSLGKENNQLSLEDWCSSRAELYPHFKCWLLILHLELAVLV